MTEEEKENPARQTLDIIKDIIEWQRKPPKDIMSNRDPGGPPFVQ